MGIEGLYVVTGGESGIGAGVARALSRLGAKVVVIDRSEERAEAVATEVGGTYRIADVADPEAVASAYASLGPLNGSIQCAGIARSTPLVTTSLEQWRRVTAVHLDGVSLPAGRGPQHGG
jgi:NAD(P)-dependent dehydrogenase (short-subunit alcohol dehydrogenase family)